MLITNEDNMELMARYPDNYFEMAIVDPPYGINVKTRVYDDGKKWDNEIPKKENIEVMCLFGLNSYLMVI